VLNRVQAASTAQKVFSLQEMLIILAARDQRVMSNEVWMSDWSECTGIRRATVILSWFAAVKADIV
jgi:hypothetical protein